MKLLLDQNLSRKLVSKLSRQFPKSLHVILCGLATADDDEIWNYARSRGSVIVTKDSDFRARSVAEGFPPKVVWIGIGNSTTQRVEEVLRAKAKEIRDFGKDKKLGCFAIYG